MRFFYSLKVPLEKVEFLLPVFKNKLKILLIILKINSIMKIVIFNEKFFERGIIL